MLWEQNKVAGTLPRASIVYRVPVSSDFEVKHENVKVENGEVTLEFPRIQLPSESGFL